MISANGLILAALASPGLFFAGLGAVSIPIVIHLIFKRRFRRIRWAALDFLLQAERQDRRKIHLQEIILLALRCLAVLLVGLLLSRPYIQSGMLATLLGADPPSEHVVLLDDSASMRYRAGAATTFDAAKDTALALFEYLHTEAPNDRVTFIKTSDLASPIVAGALLGPDVMHRIRETLGTLEASQLQANFDSALARLRSEFMDTPEAQHIGFYVISDFQRKDWLKRAQESGAAGPLDRLKPPEDQDWNFSVVLLPVGGPDRRNRAVTDLSATQPQLIAGIENRLKATISNFSGQRYEACDLRVYAAESAQAVVHVPAIPAGESREVLFDVTFLAEGSQPLRVEIPADGLDRDDHRVLICDVQPALNILLVNGEPGPHPLLDEVSLLEAALRPEGEIPSGIQANVADEGILETTNLDAFHAIALANAGSVSARAAEKLEAFVDAGGGLVTFLGDQVQPDHYNDRLFKQSKGLLPCELGRIVRIAGGGQPASWVIADPNHPSTRVFAGRDNPLLEGVGFWAWWECLIPEQDSDLTHVIAYFDPARQYPAIVEKTFGQGKTVLFASSCDLEWNDWARSPSYVVSMNELFQYVARSTPEAGVLVGGTIQRSVPADTYEGEIRVRTPSYPAEPELRLQALGDPSGREWSVRLPHADQVGVYRFSLTTTLREEQQFAVAVNPDPAESNLKACHENELRQISPEIDLEWITDMSTMTGTLATNQQELWRVILAVVATLLLVEGTLACWFGRM